MYEKWEKFHSCVALRGIFDIWVWQPFQTPLIKIVTIFSIIPLKCLSLLLQLWMFSFRGKKSFLILVLRYYLSICFTAMLQVSYLRLIKCRHLWKPKMWFARTTLVGMWKMKQSNKTHPLQLRLQGETLGRCYSTDSRGDGRGACGEEAKFSVLVSTPRAGAEARQGSTQRVAGALRAVLAWLQPLVLQGLPGPLGISPWHAWHGVGAVLEGHFTVFTALGLCPFFTPCRILWPLFPLAGRAQGTRITCEEGDCKPQVFFNETRALCHYKWKWTAFRGISMLL